MAYAGCSLEQHRIGVIPGNTSEVDLLGIRKRHCEHVRHHYLVKEDMPVTDGSDEFLTVARVAEEKVLLIARDD
jgi:hypothetical protein